MCSYPCVDAVARDCVVQKDDQPTFVAIWQSFFYSKLSMLAKVYPSLTVIVGCRVSSLHGFVPHYLFSFGSIHKNSIMEKGQTC